MKVAGERLEHIGIDSPPRPVAGHRPRVPMPPIATIVAKSQVAGEAGGIRRTRAMGQIAGDGIGRLVDAGESLGIAMHEGADAGNTIRVGDELTPFAPVHVRRSTTRWTSGPVMHSFLLIRSPTAAELTTRTLRSVFNANAVNALRHRIKAEIDEGHSQAAQFALAID